MPMSMMRHAAGPQPREDLSKSSRVRGSIDLSRPPDLSGPSRWRESAASAEHSFTPQPLAGDPVLTEVGSFSIAGKKLGDPRWANQDRYLVIELLYDQLLVAVFDGHGDMGHVIAARVRELFIQQAPLMLGRQARERPSDAFKGLFLRCQSVLESEGLCERAGTTVACALVDRSRRRVSFAHVGDSGLVLVKDGGVAYMTKEHKFDAEAERRIQASGGEVRFVSGCLRIVARGSDGPGLAMSRSLGDVAANRLGLIPEPEVSSIMPLESGSCVIVGSDGLWDYVPQTFASKVVAGAEAQELAQGLATLARARAESHRQDIDDITVVVVKACS